MKYKVFDYCWHIPHQSDMIEALSNDCDFFFCHNSKIQWNNNSIRPKPDCLEFVTHYEPEKYDFAILHIDQQAVAQTHFKRMIYDDFNGRIKDIPKIVINHGTPVYPAPRRGHVTDEETKFKCVELIKNLVGDNAMVVNSYASASASEWGFGVPIVHGISSKHWLDLPKEPRVFTALSSAGFDRYYNRDCLERVKTCLLNDYGYTLWHAKVNVKTNDSFESYKNFLGRSLLYLDTSFRTPMNRARTEAFLSGCCVIQVEGAHDLERWAKHGENILLVKNDAEEIASVIVDILENKYSLAVEIGKRGKEMATRQFSPQLYRDNWLRLIKQVVGNGRS